LVIYISVDLSLDENQGRNDYHRFTSRRSSRGIFGKHRSEPHGHLISQQLRTAAALTLNLANQNNNTNNDSMINQQPFGDLSLQSQNTLSLNQHQLSLRMNDSCDVEMAIVDQIQLQQQQQQQEAKDLEMLWYGSSVSNETSTVNRELIEHSLDIDSKLKNLIGDRSMDHILPAVTSQKHQDLYCISPQTVIKFIDYLVFHLKTLLISHKNS
jgi:hypothetical protein